MPSPDLLYTQKVLVEEGTVANNVSKRTVSVEKVSTFEGEVLKESSSVQAPNTNTDTAAHNVNNVFPIAYYNAAMPPILHAA